MRVAVLSDIHSNLVALEAVLASAGPVDAIWHLGDVVGYGPEPDAVVARLAAAGAVGVAGNHDRAAAGGDEIDWFNEDAKAAMQWTRRRIDSTTVAWLASQPVRRTESGALLVHGSPRDPIWEYVLSSSIARANLAELETRFGFHGHTHIPMVWVQRDGRIESVSPAPDTPIRFDTGERLLINPGSVGQPRDGDPRASWLELDLGASVGTWHRVEYDIPAVQAAMRDVGLPIRLAERLRHGV